MKVTSVKRRQECEECDPEYVPVSESDIEDEEPMNSLANSTFQVPEQ